MMLLSGRRFIVSLCAAAVLAAAGLMPAGEARAQGITVQEIEPNNQRDTATPLPLTSATLSGNGNQLGDVDFFQTEFFAGNLVRATLLTPPSETFSGRLQIQNFSGQVLAEVAKADFPGSPGPASITALVNVDASTPPGVGYFRISNDLPGPSPTTTQYTVLITQGVAEIEPNNDLNQAQGLIQAFPVVGSFPATTNITDDVYRFDTTEPGQTVFISLSYVISSAVTMAFQILDDTGEVVAAAAQTGISGGGGQKLPSTAVRIEEPGTFFVRIFNLTPPPTLPNTIAYTLFFRLRSGLIEQEPNQSFTEAVAMDVPATGTVVTVGGALQGPQDVDLFKVNVPGGMMLVADVDVISPVKAMDGVVSLFFREDLGVSFASSDNNSFLPPGAIFSLVNTDPFIRTVPRRGGEIFVAVGDRLNEGSLVGSEYELKLSLEAPPPSEGEPNDTLSSAKRLEEGVPVWGTIGSTGDVDTFVIDARAGEVMLVNVNAFGLGSFLDARATLRSPAGALLADASIAPFSLDPFILIPSLPEDGDYSVQISRRLGTTGSGPSHFYELTASTTPAFQAVVGNPDIDGSGRVDGFDLADLARRFGVSTGDPLFSASADLVADGSIDGQDLTVLATFFGSLLNFAGLTEIIADPRGDASPFFGPASPPPDLVGLGTAFDGQNLNLAVFYDESLAAGTGGVLSLDTDAASLTGSLGTPDAYVAARNLGSDLEIFFDTSRVRIFAIPDPRTDIFEGFVANVGDVALRSFPQPGQRRPLRTSLLQEQPTVVSGNLLSFTLAEDLLGGSVGANTALLALSVEDVEPTDRLPNQGKIPLRPPFQVGSIVSTQMVCSDDPRQLCTADAECGGTCVDVDTAPRDARDVSTALPAGPVVYLRTQTGGAQFRHFERDLDPSALDLSQIDDGQKNGQNNDEMERIFPLGNRPSGGGMNPFRWFTRDMLHNFAVRDGVFAPHLIGSFPPPDVDLYYFLGGEGDRAVVDVTTSDGGATFNAKIDLFSIPLSISALDPSTPEALLAVPASALTLLATADDKSPTDLDPRLEVILPRTSLYVVRVTGSPAQTSFPPDPVPYTLFHESLRPDEVSIPIAVRGTYPDRVSGLNVQLEFDPEKIRMTGFDLARGPRVNTPGIPGRNLASAVELVAEPVREVPGRVRFAIRALRNSELNVRNGLNNGGACPQFSTFGVCAEIPLARIRFRAVGEGSTTVTFVDNPTTPGEPLINVGAEEGDAGPVWQPSNGYGPGVRITVTAAP